MDFIVYGAEYCILFALIWDRHKTGRTHFSLKRNVLHLSQIEAETSVEWSILDCVSLEARRMCYAGLHLVRDKRRKFYTWLPLKRAWIWYFLRSPFQSEESVYKSAPYISNCPYSSNVDSGTVRQLTICPHLWTSSKSNFPITWTIFQSLWFRVTPSLMCCYSFSVRWV